MNETVNILGFVIVVFLMLFTLRWRFNKKCRKNMLCEFATDEGTGYTEFHPIIDGVLKISPTQRRAGVEYPVGHLTTVIVDYPEYWPNFLQSKAKKIWLDESTAEPLLNRSNMLLLTPQRLFNWDTQRFTALATGKSVIEEQQALAKLGGHGGMNINWKGLILLFIVGLLGVGGYMLYQYMQTGKAALGVP